MNTGEGSLSVLQGIFPTQELNWGLLHCFLVAQTVKCLPAVRRPSFNPWIGKIPWRRKWQPTLVLLPGKFHGLKSLVGYNLWGLKELDTIE